MDDANASNPTKHQADEIVKALYKIVSEISSLKGELSLIRNSIQAATKK
jgi:hypothetical protein